MGGSREVVAVVSAVAAESWWRRWWWWSWWRRWPQEVTNHEREQRYDNDTRVSKISYAASVPQFSCWCCWSAARIDNGQTTATAKAKTFATAQEAANALIEAAEQFDETALTEILGPDSYDIIHTGEPARDREVAKSSPNLRAEDQRFDAAKESASRVSCDRRRRLAVSGADRKGWFNWSFDTKAGRQEILYSPYRKQRAECDCRSAAVTLRRSTSMRLLSAALRDVNQYAQRIISTPGTQDGLAWRNSDGTWGGPIGEKVAQAIARGYTSRAEPFHGYFFKVLKGQGPAAPLGEMDLWSRT